MAETVLITGASGTKVIQQLSATDAGLTLSRCSFNYCYLTPRSPHIRPLTPWKQIFASSCLQIKHVFGCAVVSLIIFFCCFDLVSTSSHSATSGTPIMKITIIVRIGILSTNKEIPKHKVPILIHCKVVYMTIFFCRKRHVEKIYKS
jgi:hypothetical protein